jgi:hypothetical protein
MVVVLDFFLKYNRLSRNIMVNVPGGEPQRPQSPTGLNNNRCRASLLEDSITQFRDIIQVFPANGGIRRASGANGPMIRATARNSES